VFCDPVQQCQRLPRLTRKSRVGQHSGAHVVHRLRSVAVQILLTMAHARAMNNNPVCNLSVVAFAASLTDTPEQTTKAWMQSAGK
jgi:hypothetical protein